MLTKHDIYMETNRLAVLATTAIERAMERTGMTRSELADSMGVPRSRVTKALDGETNMTLKTLASFGLACGVRWHFVGVGVSDGTLALGWGGVELTRAAPTQRDSGTFPDLCMSSHEPAHDLPLVCSALEASQDPIGPLISRSPSHRIFPLPFNYQEYE